MFEQFGLFEMVIGFFGIVLVVNGVLFVFFVRYFDLFSATFFIETLSDTEKRLLNEKIKQDRTRSRYFVGLFLILFGLTAMAWALGYKSALGWPFNLLF
jgi:hypothetical protein